MTNPPDLDWPDESAADNPNWKRELLGAAPTKALRDLPVVRYVQIRMTPELATLTTRIGKAHGLSREGWLRKIIGEAIAAEIPGVDAEDIYPRMPKGRQGKHHRAETKRDK